MKKKIFAITCIMLFLLIALPTGTSQELVKDTALDSMPLAHVVVEGTGTVFLMGSSFIAGIGTCLAMIVNLESDGHIKINKLFDPPNKIELEGSHVIILIGFFGYYRHVSGIKVNGVALFAIW